MAAPTDTVIDSSSQSNGSSTIPYQELYSYQFTSDPEFRLGLAMILGQPGTPASDDQINRSDDLVLKAKCFYYSKKHGIQPPLDFLIYKSWLQTHAPDSLSQSSQPEPQTEPSLNTATSTNTEQTAEPTYPSSFSHIVELITTGQPIPGIQQIPNTILSGQEGPSTATRRLKPWEKAEDSDLERNPLPAGGGGSGASS